MADRYAVAAGNWSSTSVWSATDGGGSGASAPTNADDVHFTAASGNITVTNDVNNQACRSLDCTGFTGGWTYTGFNVNIGGAAAPASNSALKLSNTMTVTNNASSSLTFVTSAAAQTITTATRSLAPGILAVNGTGGVILQDALTVGTGANAVNVQKGTFNSNGQGISCGNFTSTTSNTRSVVLDGSAITLSAPGSTGTYINLATTTGLTWSAVGTVWTITNPGTATIATGGKAIGQIIRTGVAGSVTFTGAGSIAGYTDHSGRTVTLPASTTTTLTGTLDLLKVTLNSSSAGTAATISAAGGVTVTAEGCSIKDITATGGASFIAVNCTNVSGNTGWTFVRKARGWGVAA